MQEEIICPNCGERKNFHFNYDYTKQETPVQDVLCNECAKKEKLGTLVPNIVHLCHQDPNDDCKKFF